MTEAVSGRELRQLLFAPDNINTLFYMLNQMPNIYILHYTEQYYISGLVAV